ncbi:hypothetical protein EDB85DRAFT_1891759 [Lactarius pseudohatsudake]|nr:hypothetical protein EDB85DRAFT_1891759 [Lactarius pseudohatsudake]
MSDKLAKEGDRCWCSKQKWVSPVVIVTVGLWSWLAHTARRLRNNRLVTWVVFDLGLSPRGVRHLRVESTVQEEGEQDTDMCKGKIAHSSHWWSAPGLAVGIVALWPESHGAPMSGRVGISAARASC